MEVALKMDIFCDGIDVISSLVCITEGNPAELGKFGSRVVQDFLARSVPGSYVCREVYITRLRGLIFQIDRLANGMASLKTCTAVGISVEPIILMRDLNDLAEATAMCHPWSVVRMRDATGSAEYVLRQSYM